MLSLLLAVVAIAIVIIYRRKVQRNRPTGPTGLPLVGNILQIVKDPHLKLSKWAEKYGKIYTINLVGKTTLVVNEAKAMKDIFSTMASTGKLQSDIFECAYGGPLGIVNSEGKVFVEQRQFVMKTLKQFGFGKGTMLEPVILGDCDDLCEWIDGKMTEKDGVQLAHALMRASSNTLWNMVTGKRLKNSESEMIQAMEEFTYELEIATRRSLAFSSNMKYWAPELSGYNQFSRACKKIHKIVEKYFMEHEKAREQFGGAPTDLIDAYIEQVENCQDTERTFYGEKGWESSFYAVIVLLIAGSETTGSTINWMVFYLALHPEIQKKLQKEVDGVIGDSRDPSLNDRSKMPYLESVILETLRMSALAPFGLIHKLVENIEYENYVLPKDTLLLANIYHCHHDKKVWKNPEQFRPERFLEGTEEQNKVLRDKVVAFQQGRRTCPGEFLEKDVLFLFATKLSLKYSFYPHPDVKVEDYLKPNVGFFLAPKHLGVVFKQRQ